MEPSGQPPRLINNFGQTITVDYEKNRMRLSFDAVREYPARNPLKFAEVIDGDAGMLEAPQADGKTTQETSDILRISIDTVNYHVKNAISKLRSANKTAATVRAAMLGLLG